MSDHLCVHSRTTALSLLLSWQEEMQHISFLRDSTSYRFLNTFKKANSLISSPLNSLLPKSLTPLILVGSNLSLHVVKRKHRGSICLPFFPPASNCDSISKSCRPVSKIDPQTSPVFDYTAGQNCCHFPLHYYTHLLTTLFAYDFVLIKSEPPGRSLENLSGQ